MRSSTKIFSLVLLVGFTVLLSGHPLLTLAQEAESEVLSEERQGDNEPDIVAEETGHSEPAPMSPLQDCKARMTGDRFILHCLEEKLETAKRQYKEASARLQQTTHALEDNDVRRNALRAFVNSNMAFDSYRDSECLRRKSLVPETLEAHFVYLSCQTELTADRTNRINISPE